jgi:uncharacterized protein YcnI
VKKTFLIAAALLASSAQAHITLEQDSARAGSYQKLTFRVIGAKPMPKAGWNIRLVEGKLAVPVESHGQSIASAVREVNWSGGPLPDAYYDEFSVQVKLPAEPGKLYFKIVQQCEKGSVAWDELPGEAGVKVKAPAPVLNVLPAEGAVHQH